MPEFTLTVVAKKHRNAVTVDDPSAGLRQIGFLVVATLRTADVDGDLQPKYKLEQYVYDKWWLQVRDDESSTDWDDEEDERDWQLDEFGYNGARGRWDTSDGETTFTDEPGFLGTTGKNAQALTKTQRLSKYEVQFKWTVTKARTKKTTGTLLHLTLEAESNDRGDITYTGSFGGGTTILTSGSTKIEESVTFTL